MPYPYRREMHYRSTVSWQSETRTFRGQAAVNVGVAGASRREPEIKSCASFISSLEPVLIQFTHSILRAKNVHGCSARLKPQERNPCLACDMERDHPATPSNGVLVA